MAAMIYICCVFLLSVTLINGQANTTLNTTSPKDMYVVRATVYQVGILTKRRNDSIRFAPGHQESITFYHKNGSNLDMGAIPRPLQTNVTAENMVGVVPINGTSQYLPWSALKDFTLPMGSTHPPETNKIAKREIAKVEKGAALIPKETGVQSIALPPLLALNNNLSKIPVPIPNVSVVSYAKVNTLIHNP